MWLYALLRYCIILSHILPMACASPFRKQIKFVRILCFWMRWQLHLEDAAVLTGSRAGMMSAKKVQFWHRREWRKVCCGFPLTVAWASMKDFEGKLQHHQRILKLRNHSWKTGDLHHVQSSASGWWALTGWWWEKLRKRNTFWKLPSLSPFSWSLLWAE